MKKKICVVSSTRAEFGLLKPVIKAVQSDLELDLQLLVTGAHLNQLYGNTQHEIVECGIPICSNVKIDLSDNSCKGIAMTIADVISKFTIVFSNLKPDLVVLLGDRYEIMAVAISATILTIPIAHIHGGETTEGAMDEVFRHCITKMSYLHFASTEVYRRRIVQLGEAPDRVFNVGALGVENIKSLSFMNKIELEKSIGFSIDDNTLLVTFHPETLSVLGVEKQVQILLSALEMLPELKIIFTRANADAGGIIINACLEKYVKLHMNQTKLFSSLGQIKYLSAMCYVKAVVGNSSSGVIEAPALHTPSVNIGKRQQGRVQCQSTINCSLDKNAIKESIQQALSQEFQLCAKHDFHNPYEKAGTAKNIVNIIKSFVVYKKIELNKSFYDIDIKRIFD